MLGRANHYLLVTSDWCISVKNMLAWSSVMFHAFKIPQLCPVVSYVVTAAHTFGFRSAVNEKPNKWWPVDRWSCSDRDACFWQDLYPPTQPLSRVFRDCTHTVQVKHILLGKGQYLHGTSVYGLLKIVYLLSYAIWSLEILPNTWNVFFNTFITQPTD
jgi:hypothetical protein